MTATRLIILLLVVGVVLTLLPLDAGIKKLIYVILAVLVVLWLLRFLGIGLGLGL